MDLSADIETHTLDRPDRSFSDLRNTPHLQEKLKHTHIYTHWEGGLTPRNNNACTFKKGDLSGCGGY